MDKISEEICGSVQKFVLSDGFTAVSEKPLAFYNQLLYDRNCLGKNCHSKAVLDTNHYSFRRKKTWQLE